jgi:hypothetical protein
LNSTETLEGVRIELLQQLQDLQGAPSVAMQQVPPAFERPEAPEDDPDERDPLGKTKNGDGTRKQHQSELYDRID